MIDAKEALQYKLVNYVVSLDELLSKASEIIKSISTTHLLQLQPIKSINVGFNHRENGFEKEINEFGNCFGSEDFVEGTTAFMERENLIFECTQKINRSNCHLWIVA